MRLPARTNRGYSLIELLVVLTIIGILSVVGVMMIGNRRAVAVRSLLDELEGSLSNARQAAAATGRDIAIVQWGSWSAADPLVVAYGDATGLTDLQIQTIAKGLLASTPPASTVQWGQTVAVAFHYLATDTTQARARIVPVNSTDWTTAMTALSSGAINQAIDAKDPFNSVTGFMGMVGDTTNLFTGALSRTVVSGSSQRFTSTFCIEIVGTSPDAGPLPGSPMGLIFVQANGGTIYKFYNPGELEGNGLWRRI